ncbi:hypothetical protein POTOM_055456 [Populus tomentosa]|uniref:Retrotransposon Copia-like N-terminal domain-containing protein n=1 Tax=Populus tomentosa TaxID=118781 RepID=A0A8X7XXC9_POPTO|nr:hypothetical protein POTOM_055456 [Populus tomentosa]
MANTNTTPAPVPILPPSTTTISVKLDGSHNYLAWKMQFLNLLRGHDLVGFIDGTETCPPKSLDSGLLNSAYVVWQKKDICLLGWILASLSEKLVSTVYGMETSQQVWTALQTRFSSQSRSRISHLKRQLQTLTQGTTSCSAYLENAKHLADQLAAAGKPVDDQDLISFLLSGLPSTYNPFVTSFNFACRDNDFTFEDFQAELLSYENLLDFNHSTRDTDTNHFAFAAHKSKAPIYGRKKGPLLPSPKLHSVISSPLLSNVSAAVASQDNPSFHSPAISHFLATNSAHSSSATASNCSSSPSPISNSENPPDVEIETSSISPFPDPDPTSPNPVVQPTFSPIQTRSKTGVEADRTSKGLHLRQTKYICDLLDKSHMAGAKPLASPIVATTKLSEDSAENPGVSTPVLDLIHSVD